ncbi:hypothetical protein CSUI_001113 [Cystoisospora suis]|uniref:Uncharacterized protein n=1 Tax=Cystoisospora suis TaxID=483139 RepID=A0A2C6LDT3_9APIC|nr:hypothetical protein CSUI_001113 [Cystoisospora suis]
MLAHHCHQLQFSLMFLSFFLTRDSCFTRSQQSPFSLHFLHFSPHMLTLLHQKASLLP